MSADYFKGTWKAITDGATKAWNWLKSLFDWVPSFSGWSLPDLDFSSIAKGWENVKSMFDWVPSVGDWKLPTLNTAKIEAAWQVVRTYLHGHQSL